MDNNFVLRTSIPQYFCKKNVFITGGSGFMGKCLIEKLLRSCPNIGNIYMLIRPKKDKSIEERCKKILENQAFAKLKEINPDALQKIKPIVGNVQEINAGLSEMDRENLINTVHIVYHLAATVRFTEALTSAIIMNARGTREICKLVLEMKNICVFLHMSTSYCQLDKSVIDEKAYPSNGDWREAIHIAEKADPELLNYITSKYVGNYPNTYTFTKSLGEHVVIDMCERKVPTIIYRPAIVISAAHEPIPGYVDNFNGPIGLLTGLSKGLIRTIYSNSCTKQSFIPVDTATKGVIMATWEKGCEMDVKPISWYSASGKNVLDVTNTEISEIGVQAIQSLPLKCVWYPSVYVKKNVMNFINRENFISYYLNFIIFQMIPAVILNFVYKLLRIKMIDFLTLQRKIYTGSLSLAFFAHNEWQINNDNFLQLEERLLDEDKEAFSYRRSEITFFNISRALALYMEPNVFKTDLEKQAKVLKSYQMKFWLMYVTVKGIFYISITWLIYILFLETTIKYIFSNIHY